jgi:MHS family proline/betaine transporter-like MFS transporter
VLALALGALGLYMRRGLPESESFRELRYTGQLSEAPLREAFTGYRRVMLVGIALGWLPVVSYYLMGVYLSGYLLTEGGLSQAQALYIQTLGIFVSLFFIPLSGWLSDRVGRKPLVVGYSVAGFILAYLLFRVFSEGWEAGDIAAQVVFAGLVGFAYGVWPVTIVELYPTRVRSSALALSFNVVAGFVGGTTPLIATYLVSVIGSPLAPAIYLGLAGLISLIPALGLEETAGRPLKT